MANPGPTSGTRMKDYRELAITVDSEQVEVQAWRGRIDRAHSILRIDARKEIARKGDEYLAMTKPSRNRQVVYLQYLLPILEELHRRTLPAVPTPRAEAFNNRGVETTKKTQQFLAAIFKAQDADIRTVSDDLQWDDDRYGVFIGKVEWRMDYRNAGVSKADENTIAVEIDRAQAENENAYDLGIGADDHHETHVQEHLEALAEMASDTEEYISLDGHIREHQAQLIVVQTEGAKFSRVRPWMYLYDPDVPWKQRAWEAERQDVKVADLHAQGYLNLNISNLPAAVVVEQQTNQPLFEDIVVRIWRIHDRRNNLELVISADGPPTGRFLRKGEPSYGEIDIYNMMSFRPWNPDQTWGTSTIETALGVLDRLALVDFYIDRHVKNHANYKVIVSESVDSTKFKAALNNPDAKYVPGSKELLAGGYKEYKPPPIPDSLLQLRGLLLNELRRLSGLSAQETGESNPHAITATESGARTGVATAKKASRQEIMAEMLTWTAKTYVKLYRRFGTIRVPIRVLDEEKEAFEDFDPATLPENVNVIMDVTSETDEVRIAEAQNAERVVTFLQQSEVPIDQRELAIWFVGKMGVSNAERFFLPGPVGPENIDQGMPSQPRVTADSRTLSFPTPEQQQGA